MARPKQSSSNQLARAVVADAARAVTARAAFAAHAARAATPPKGMGRTASPLIRGLRFVGGPGNTDPLTLNRIPVKRAVRVGKQWFNSKSIRSMLARDPRATNPLTRQPFPVNVRERYSISRAHESAAKAAIREIKAFLAEFYTSGRQSSTAPLERTARRLGGWTSMGYTTTTKPPETAWVKEFGGVLLVKVARAKNMLNASLSYTDRALPARWPARRPHRAVIMRRDPQTGQRYRHYVMLDDRIIAYLSIEAGPSRRPDLTFHPVGATVNGPNTSLVIAVEIALKSMNTLEHTEWDPAARRPIARLPSIGNDDTRDTHAAGLAFAQSVSDAFTRARGQPTRDVSQLVSQNWRSG